VRDAGRFYDEPAAPPPWWVLVLAGVIAAPVLFALGAAWTLIFWAIKGAP
jgi:hypothetical protein